MFTTIPPGGGVKKPAVLKKSFNYYSLFIALAGAGGAAAIIMSVIISVIAPPTPKPEITAFSNANGGLLVPQNNTITSMSPIVGANLTIPYFQGFSTNVKGVQFSQKNDVSVSEIKPLLLATSAKFYTPAHNEPRLFNANEGGSLRTSYFSFVKSQGAEIVQTPSKTILATLTGSSNMPRMETAFLPLRAAFAPMVDGDMTFNLSLNHSNGISDFTVYVAIDTELTCVSQIPSCQYITFSSDGVYLVNVGGRTKIGDITAFTGEKQLMVVFKAPDVIVYVDSQEVGRVPESKVFSSPDKTYTVSLGVSATPSGGETATMEAKTGTSFNLMAPPSYVDADLAPVEMTMADGSSRTFDAVQQTFVAWPSLKTVGCDNDGICEPGEDPTTCPSDCTSGPVCGNLICEAGENELTIASRVSISPGDTAKVKVYGDYAYVLHEGSLNLEVFNVSDRTHPILVSSVVVPTSPNSRDFDIKDNNAYVIFSDGYLRVYENVTSSPVFAGNVYISPDVTAVYVRQDVNIVYTMEGLVYPGQFSVFDISIPATPNLLSTASVFGGSVGLDYANGYAYSVTSDGKVQAIDVLDNNHPYVRASMNLGTAGVVDFTTSGNYLYALNIGNGRLQTVYIQDPALSFLLMGEVPVGSAPNFRSVHASGSYVYVLDYSSIKVYDILSDHAHPRFVTEAVAGDLGYRFLDIFSSGNYAFSLLDVESEGELRIFDSAGLCPGDCGPVGPVCGNSVCDSGEGPGIVSNTAITAGESKKVFVSGNYAYVANDRQPGIIGGSFEIWNISNPSTPVLESRVGYPGAVGAKDVVVSNGLAYVATEASGAVSTSVYSISNPASPSWIRDASGIGAPLAIDSSGSDYLLYGGTGSTGFSVYDFSGFAPTLRGTVPTATEPRDIYVTGGYAYVAEGRIGLVSDRVLEIFDVTNPASLPTSPIGRSPADVISGGLAVSVSGNYAYLIADNDQHYISGTSTLQVFDITDKTSPVVVSGTALRIGAGTGHDAALDVTGSKAYTYVTDGSLKVYNISNPSAPVMIEDHPWAVRDVFASAGRYVYLLENMHLSIYDTVGSCPLDCPGSVTTTTFRAAASGPPNPGPGRLSQAPTVLPAIVKPVLDANGQPADIGFALLEFYTQNGSNTATMYAPVRRGVGAFEQAADVYWLIDQYAKGQVDSMQWSGYQIQNVSNGPAFEWSDANQTWINKVSQMDGLLEVSSLGSAMSDPNTGEVQISFQKPITSGTVGVAFKTDENIVGASPFSNVYTVTVECVDTDQDGMCDEKEPEFCLGTTPGAEIDCFGCSQAQMDVDGDNFCTYVVEAPGQVCPINCQLPNGSCDSNCAVNQPKVSISAFSGCTQPFEWQVTWDGNPVCVDCDQTEACAPTTCYNGANPGAYGYCDSNQTYCFPDDPCDGGTGAICGNNICETGEDSLNCPADCGAGAICGNGICEAGEDAMNCPADCGAVSCNNNGICEPELGEDSKDCPLDCSFPATCNNNGTCEPELGETSKSCPGDCGSSCGAGCDCNRDGICSKQCPVGCPMECAQDPDCGIEPSCKESKWCNAKLGKDMCPTVAGEFQGCPYGNKNILKLEVIDRSSAKDRCYYLSNQFGVNPPYDIGTPTCILPIQEPGSVIGQGLAAPTNTSGLGTKFVFDLNDLIGVTLTTDTGQSYTLTRELLNFPVIYSLILKSIDTNPDVKNALVGTCTAMNAECTVGKPAAGDYLDIVKISLDLPLGSPPDARFPVTAVDGVLESEADFVNGLATNTFTFQVRYLADGTWHPFDNDNDGVCDVGGSGESQNCPGFDLCPNTPAGQEVNQYGCSASQVDDDLDGVCNPGTTIAGINFGAPYCTGTDQCPATIAGQTANTFGCSRIQVDEDKDGICDPGKANIGAPYCTGSDSCPNTIAGQPANPSGCSWIQVDEDKDGICDPGKANIGAPYCTGADQCPNTIAGQPANTFGCSWIQVDEDKDGICDPGRANIGAPYCTGTDQCPATPAGQPANTLGCSWSQVDQDHDGLCDPGKESLGATLCTGTDQCPAVSGLPAFFGCPVGLRVEVQEVDASTKPATKKDEALETKVYNAGSTCATGFGGFKPINYEKIWNGCTAEATKNETNSPNLRNLVTDLVMIGSTTGNKFVLVRSPESVDKTRDFVGFDVPSLLYGQTRDLGFNIAPKTSPTFVPTKDFTKDSKGIWHGSTARVVQGSYLEIISPEYTVWSGSEYIYPFVFFSDSEWVVDVCMEVPEGYQIVEPGTCTQVLIAGQPFTANFILKDVGSPRPDVKVKLKLQHKGKTQNLNFDVPGRRKGKDK